ncbi:uncharacterized protein SCHCODRAFT_02617180 [Schizophyllum commune H4-8]|uniref:uncharacterized protein n=1 Tax=Schizophyllum commune (strain H4-8 / FGSC 9210) TaxID=578458 RepID=UPI00215FDE61|nr:uncharacterized protein SCHCODRAFT_02617180 [Schizophyllum commune H4-8]KAI5894509.1 hypothetical protein SCHCODRAFT_02617180 [Schizophyllum commune H4-8]
MSHQYLPTRWPAPLLPAHFVQVALRLVTAREAGLPSYCHLCRSQPKRARLKEYPRDHSTSRQMQQQQDEAG